MQSNRYINADFSSDSYPLRGNTLGLKSKDYNKEPLEEFTQLYLDSMLASLSYHFLLI